MKLKKLSAKVADYNQRLADGKASKIKPDHVGKVLEKLRAKEAELTEELAAAPSREKQTRIQRKLDVAREHIERAEWLLAELE